ncbi:ABC transporter ATP-binding protein [Alicyclobacillus fodiniaquatilis]|uniref:ABC transporter ATP-binding protein n=1 Tax=Alicyclobacillus fodiniaquatilis TaxID=1661150 RepID=A0ABW4JHG6_9BACL
MVQVKQRILQHSRWPIHLRFIIWTLVTGKTRSIVYAALMVISGLFPAAGVWVAMHVFTAALHIHAVHIRVLLRWIAAWAGIALVSSLIWSVYQVVEEALKLTLEAEMERSLQQKTARLALETFERGDFHDMLERAREMTKPGELMNLLAESWFIGQSVVTTIAIAGVIATWNAWMLTAVIVVAALDVLAQLGQAREAHALKHALAPNQRLRRYIQDVLTTPASAKEVRTFAAGERLLTRWASLHCEDMAREWRVQRRHELVRSALAIGGVLGVVLGIAIVCFQTISGALSAAEFAAILYGLQQFHTGVNEAIGRVGYLRQYLLRIGDLFTYLTLEPEIRDKTDTDIQPGPLEVRSVSFCYPRAKEKALSDISLTVPFGQRVAVVGENGAGKSTLVRLLLGLYEPTTGAIQLGGKDIQTLRADRRASISSVVFQDFIKYAFTLRENIGLGNYDKMDDEQAIVAAAKAGGADEVASALSAGYETLLTTRFADGTDLSGGQWQKVAISRAFMRNPMIVALDEPTSALDPQMETEVLERFLSISGERTAIIVSHRLGIARLCDRILVMSNGRLVEEGTHEDLLQLGGEYARMWNLQAQRYRTPSQPSGD